MADAKETKQGTTGSYVSRRQLASILSLSPKCISRLMHRKQIPYIRLSPRKHLYDVEAVKHAIKQYEIPASRG